MTLTNKVKSPTRRTQTDVLGVIAHLTSGRQFSMMVTVPGVGTSL